MIMENVAPNELFELKSFLGEDLVDQSIELRKEITTLLEINKQISSEIAAGDVENFLPEPPEVRERLLKEIQFFVTGIRDQARQQGRDIDNVLQKRPRDIVDYAYESASSNSSRPTTSDESRLSTSRSSYRATPISERADINLMKEKLNYMAFDDVKSNLRQYLQDEVEQLDEDLQQIHLSLCSDTDTSGGRTTQQQPSIAELRTERRELEQILMQQVSRPSTAHNAGSVVSSPSLRSAFQAGQPPRPKKPLFRLKPDERPSLVKPGPYRVEERLMSPPHLQPLQKQGLPIESTHVRSPLDLSLLEDELDQETDAYITSEPAPFEQTLVRSINGGKSRNTLQHPVTKPPPPGPTIRTTAKYNSAQRFRQRILQNRQNNDKIN